jgi:CRISPR-associated exonuclease Cas4
VNTAVWLLLIFGAGLLLAAWGLRQRGGLPDGNIAYSDTDVPAQPLFSNRYGLVGKPDYVVLRNGMPIPIEVKPTRSADEPYESDRMQLVAYCLLLEETNAKAPHFGVLRYRERSFRIDYTPDVRAQLLDQISEMRACLAAAEVERSHDSAARCAVCGFRRSCEESLAD